MNTILNKRESDALKRLGSLISGLPKLIADKSLMKIIAFILTFVQVFGALVFDTPTKPGGPELDMSKFVLTWADEFNEGSFDKTYWSGHYCWGDDGTWPRDEYHYWNRGQVDFRDGNLIIKASYLENGPVGPEGPYGPAYYSYGMDTNPFTDGPAKPGFEQLYGYFEIRCILPKGPGLNPAFWLLSDGMFRTDPIGLTDGGVTGAEIDVFETKYEKKLLYKNSVYHTIHVDSYDEYHRSEMQGHFYADRPYEKFNTYGLEWNPDGYIFYINGVETARTDFGGVCAVPLYLIISLGIGPHIDENKELPAEFIVDYVRAYQYADRLND
ncbi:MAG: glycoside hydrolase family 16 protein [Acutalibacteraceae bacterium]|jgi:beta-glucanase (GH16 family)